MIVTCPQCSKRYLIEDSTLTHRGKTLRCGACAHMWRFETTTPPETQPTSSVPESRHATLGPSPHATTFTSGPASRLSQGWVLYFSVWILLLGSIVLCRHHLVRLWPVLRPLYDAVGLPLHQTETLELLNLRVAPVKKPENYMLLQGEIVNTGSEARSVPLFRIHLQEPLAPLKHTPGLWQKLYAHWASSPSHRLEWTYQLSHRRLFPKEKLSFEILLPCAAEDMRPGMVGAVAF